MPPKPVPSRRGARWSAAKCQRIYDKLRENVTGQTDDPEHLLDVLIAAWEEMHREATAPNWYVLNRAAGLTLADTTGDGCGRYSEADKDKILARIRERADGRERGLADAA